MKRFKNLPILLLVVICVFVSIACSNVNSPIVPANNDISGISIDLPEAHSSAADSRSMLAVYDAVIDPSTETFTITPVDRSSQFHFPLTQMYPGVLQISGYGWTPNFWADIKLTHPFPGSGIDAFDPRVIAILPANPGVSFNYPVFNCIGNNSVVLEPDGYTKLFDSFDGTIPGNTNPYKAYLKDQSNRIWASTGVYQETQRWDMNINGFGGPLKFKFVVDVSTNYPDDPQPVLDNAPEPADIDISLNSNLNPLGGTASLDITILDWQGLSRIGGVSIESPNLFDGIINIPYSGPGPNPDEYIFSAVMTNDLGAPGGEYSVLVAAWDTVSGIYLYDEVSVSVVAFNPEIVKTVSMPANAHDVAVTNGYAFVGQDHVNLNYGVQVIDVIPAESASIIKTVNSGNHINDIFISGNYAYATDPNNFGNNTVFVLSINPPESSSIVAGCVTPGWASGVYAIGNFIYVADSEAGLQIIDATNFTYLHIIKSVDTPGEARGIFVSGEYAYVADGGSGLQIIDITPRESAHIVKTIDTPGWAEKVFVSNGFAYVADNDSGLQIIDVNPISSAAIVNEVETTSAIDVKIVGRYAFVADFWGGLDIIDIYPPEEAFIVTNVDTTSETYGVDVEGNYAYLADWANGLQIVKLW